MSNLFFIGDTHFGHSNIIKFEPVWRPFESIQEHDEAIIDLWNKTVQKNDKVWFVGDIAMNKTALMRCVPRLNGNIYLVMGNHDKFATSAYMDAGVHKLLGMASVHKTILSHIPVHESQMYRYDANIHGHIHGKASPSVWHINVSIEANAIRCGQLRPVEWEELKDSVAEAKAYKSYIAMNKQAGDNQ